MALAIICTILALSVILYKLYKYYDNEFNKDLLEKKTIELKRILVQEAEERLLDLKIEEESEKINLKSAKLKNEIDKLKNKIKGKSK